MKYMVAEAEWNGQHRLEYVPQTQYGKHTRNVDAKRARLAADNPDWGNIRQYDDDQIRGAFQRNYYRPWLSYPPKIVKVKEA